VREYDIAQFKKYASQVLFGAAMVTFIHVNWGIIQPLVIQTVMTPMQLYKLPLFQIFIMGETGEITKRPFKEDNPLASLFSGGAAASTDAPAAEEAEQPPAEADAALEGTKSKKKRNKRTPPVD